MSYLKVSLSITTDYYHALRIWICSMNITNSVYIICLLLFHLIFLNDNCSINCSWTSTADWIQSITILKIRIITFLLLECRARSSKVWLCLKVKVLERSCLRSNGLAWSETLFGTFRWALKMFVPPQGKTSFDAEPQQPQPYRATIPDVFSSLLWKLSHWGE